MLQKFKNNDELDKLIEEVLALDDDAEELEDIEMPSEETWKEWIRLGEERYRKRRRRKMIIATAVAVAIIIGVIIYLT